MALLEIFFAWRGGDFASGPLPFGGGYAEQPSALMLCLRHMAGVLSQVPRAARKPAGD